MRIRRVVAAALLLALAGTVTPAAAADITLLCSNGMQAVVEELIPQFERASKHRVVVTYDLAANIKRRVEAGDVFDVVIVTPAVADDLIKAGRLAPDSRATLARAGLGIAIRSGAAKPDIGTVEAFTRALLNAKSIAYAKGGASGAAFVAIVQKLGIAEKLSAKSQLTSSAEAVGVAVSGGAAEFGVLPISEILPIKGAELLAPFPAGSQSYITMVAGINARAPQRVAAADFVAFVLAPSATSVVTKKGMER
jgi:molybdate transport system substrate-binding protein